MVKFRKFLAARLNAMAAWLDPQPATTASTGWIYGPFAGSTYSASSAADAHIRFTHGGES